MLELESSDVSGVLAAQYQSEFIWVQFECVQTRMMQIDAAANAKPVKSTLYTVKVEKQTTFILYNYFYLVKPGTQEIIGFPLLSTWTLSAFETVSFSLSSDFFVELE